MPIGGIPNAEASSLRTQHLLFVGLALFVAACGGDRQAPATEASRSIATHVRFGDHDPHDWSGSAPWNYPVHGVDVSRWQGDIDWPQVRASGAAFAFIKATEGGDVIDPRFRDNWDGAHRAGVARGAYHFYYFCRTAAEQAAWFLSHVPRDRSALPPVLDMEWNHKSRTCPHRPQPETVRAEMRTFLQIVRGAYGKRPVIYTTVDFYHDNELWRLPGYDYWLRSVAGHPSEVYPGRDWTFWQYTGTGKVPGIDGPADINVFAGSPGQWRSWRARNGG